jgi:hypothetical protein
MILKNVMEIWKKFHHFPSYHNNNDQKYYEQNNMQDNE